MSKPPVEREAKLELGQSVPLPSLDGVLPGVAATAADPQSLDATYLDTDDRRLLALGITFRHRIERPGIGRGTWTLKLPVPGDGPTVDRRELEWKGAAASPPAEALSLLAGVTRGATLGPVAHIFTHRSRIVLRDAEGESLAEVDDDRVTADAGVSAARFREVEVELTGGTPKLVEAVARLLISAGADPGHPQPKLQRVLGSGSEPPGSSSVPLGSKSRLEDVLVAALESGLERWLANDPGVRLGEDPEAIHKVRVAARRLRSDLGALAPHLEPAWLATTIGDLKWAAAALGRARDLDVLREWIDDNGDRSTEEAASGVEALLARLDSERDLAVSELERALADPRYLALLDSLVAARDAPPWRAAPDSGSPQASEPRPASPPRGKAAPELRRLLRRRARKIRRQVKRAGVEPSPGDLHELRKRTKRLRYNAELSGPVLGSKGDIAGKAADSAAELQSVLGDHHDAAVAEQWLIEASEVVGPDGAFAAGILVAAARRQQRERADAGRRLVEALDAKRLRRLLR